MPDYNYSDANTYFSGSVRLFSPLARDSARRYCQMYPYSTSYNNTADMIAHSFTIPYNSVLQLNNYQGNDDTPTTAVEKVTADVCSKLRNSDGHGANLRIYLIKYRKQTQYKAFPSDEVKNHSYTTIDNCADVKYDVSTEADLKAKLELIATDIKSFANYTAAKNVD